MLDKADRESPRTVPHREIHEYDAYTIGRSRRAVSPSLPIMNYVFPNFPYLLEFRLEEMSEHEPMLSQYAVDQFNAKFDPSSGQNAVRLDRIPELGKLWMIFLRICNTHFRNLGSIEEGFTFGNSFSYIQNNMKSANTWHAHNKTASITGIYYLSVPDETGTLSVITPFLKEKEVKVRQGNLYLSPGWLIHRPNPQLSEENRISININLLTSTRPILKQSQKEVMW